jgi:hypothetical protein
MRANPPMAPSAGMETKLGTRGDAVIRSPERGGRP